MIRWLGLIALAASAAACGAKAQVFTPVDGPPLAPPTPPTRVIVPAPERPTLPPSEEAAPPVASPAAGRQAGPPATRPTTPPPTTLEPPTPPPVLVTTANSAEFEKRIRAQMARAEADLAQINRQTLSVDARGQFDAARGFLRQAEAAIKLKNLVFAGQLADKAATLAAMLRRTATTP